MLFKDLFQTLEKNKYYVFSYEDILSFYPNEKKLNLKKSIYRWKQKGWIKLLKKGLYELSYPKDFIIPDLYVANKLYSPSYISLETALSNYSIIPEVSMAVTSISTKSTRTFKNEHGLFTYRTVKPTCFTGYHVMKHDNFSIFIADPEKALIDYLYFKNYRNKAFSLSAERLDKDVVANLKKKKLTEYAKQYKLNLKEFYADI